MTGGEIRISPGPGQGGEFGENILRTKANYLS